MKPEELRASIERLRATITAIHARCVREKRAMRPDELRKAESAHADITEAEQMLEQLSGPGRGYTPEPVPPTDEPGASLFGTRGLLSSALAANERAELLPDAARAHMERELRADDDPQSRLAQCVVALADRNYLRAFAKVLRDPVAGGHEWTPEERQAVRRVRDMQAAMNLGTGPTGSFLVPYDLDPQIRITASYKDPMRELSYVTTTALTEKRFVTSAGVSSSWDPEETEVSDDSPVLAQPVIATKKAATFVPISIELGEDSDILQQIGRLFAESKAAHESLSFTLSQTNGPIGLISAIVAAGGASVIATATNALAAADAYANQAALPARWRSTAKFMANLSIINGYRQLPKAANIQESIVDDSGPVPKMAGWELHENSQMDGALTASQPDYALISGDFKQYAIVDRIGAVIELVPHLFGANRRPTGQRGVYMHWRVGADVLVADAFRLTNYSA
jgi:HK97 family phage major capsid protein